MWFLKQYFLTNCWNSFVVQTFALGLINFYSDYQELVTLNTDKSTTITVTNNSYIVNNFKTLSNDSTTKTNFYINIMNASLKKLITDIYQT